MATYKLKRFSVASKMKEVAEEVYFEDLAPKDKKEKLAEKASRVVKNKARKAAVEFRKAPKSKKALIVGLPVSGALAAGATVKTLRDKKKAKEEK